MRSVGWYGILSYVGDGAAEIMEMDARMLLTVGGIVVSIASAAAIVRQQLATVIRELKDMKSDYESRLRDLDKRTDQQEVAIDLNAQKTSVLSGILSPDKLDKSSREIERISIMARTNESRISHLEKIHNNRHIYVPKPNFED